MSGFLIPLNIYNYESYKAILDENHSCDNFYEDKPGYFKALLKLSNYNCFYCGSSLLSHNEKGVLFDKEHIINKTIDKNKNYALNRCIHNLIPICKTCNSKKLVIPMTLNFKSQLKALEEICEQNKGKTSRRKPEECSIEDCLELLSKESFDPFSQDIKFDILANRYEGNISYIEMLELNKRSENILDKFEEAIYNFITTYPEGGYLEYLKTLFPSTLEGEYIDFLNFLNIVNSAGTIDLKKLNNLIRTRNLLKNIY